MKKMQNREKCEARGTRYAAEVLAIKINPSKLSPHDRKIIEKMVWPGTAGLIVLKGSRN